MSNGNRFSGAGGGRRNDRPKPEAAPPDADFERLLHGIDLGRPGPDTFDGTASQIATRLANPPDKKFNKSSQLRRFHDEIIRYADAHRPDGSAQAAERFSEALPFIRMLAAQVQYAKARELVDANFTAFMQVMLRKIQTPTDLHRFRALFEAVIGFMPKRD